MVVQCHESLVIVLTVVQEHIFVATSAGKQVSLLAFSRRSRLRAVRNLMLARGYLLGVGEADHLVVVGLHEEILGQRRVVKLMDSDVADFVATGEVVPIWTDSNAPDRVHHVHQI